MPFNQSIIQISQNPQKHYTWNATTMVLIIIVWHELWNFILSLLYVFLFEYAFINRITTEFDMERIHAVSYMRVWTAQLLRINDTKPCEITRIAHCMINKELNSLCAIMWHVSLLCLKVCISKGHWRSGWLSVKLSLKRLSFCWPILTQHSSHQCEIQKHTACFSF